MPNLFLKSKPWKINRFSVEFNLELYQDETTNIKLTVVFHQWRDNARRGPREINRMRPSKKLIAGDNKSH